MIVLEEAWGPSVASPPEAALGARLDRPFGQHASALARALGRSVQQLLGRPLHGIRARRKGYGRVSVELLLTAEHGRRGELAGRLVGSLGRVD